MTMALFEGQMRLHKLLSTPTTPKMTQSHTKDKMK